MLEVGAGLGVLTACWPRAVAHVHAVEIDRRLEPALTRTLEGLGNVTRALGRRDAPRPRRRSRRRRRRSSPTCPTTSPRRSCSSRSGACPALRALVRAGAAGGRRAAAARPGDALYGGPERAVRARARAGRPPPRVAQRLRAAPNVDSMLVAFTRRRAGRSSRRDWPAVVATACVPPSRTAARRSATRSRWRAGAPTARRSRRPAAPPASIRRARAEALAGRDLRGPRAARPRRRARAASRSISACASGRAAPTATTSSRPCSPRSPLGDELELEPARDAPASRRRAWRAATRS